MMNSLNSLLTILATCIAIACAMPNGNQKDNYAKLKAFDIDHESYLFDDSPATVIDISNQTKPSEDSPIVKRNETTSCGRENPLFPYPLHASCRVEWTFGVDCEEVLTRLVNQIKLWTGPDGCEDGGEKCLYEVRSLSNWLLRGTHTTPVSFYVDNFGFRLRTTDYGCYVKSYSYSTVIYALLDYGTNYCNMFNLIDGSGLNKEPSFSETTCDKICTQYTTADCDVY